MGPEHSPAVKKLSLTIVYFYIALHHKSENKKGPWDGTVGLETEMEQDSGTRQWDCLYDGPKHSPSAK